MQMSKEGRQRGLYSIMKEGDSLIRELNKLAANTRKKEKQPTQLATMLGVPKEENNSIKRARLYNDMQT
jgi:hypothetical protein